MCTISIERCKGKYEEYPKGEKIQYKHIDMYNNFIKKL